MEKVLIAIKDRFSRNLYKDIFEKEGSNVLTIDEEDKLLVWIKIENPNIIIVDIGIFQKEGSKEKFIKEILERKIPVIGFAQFRTEENKKRAMELEARDFISSSDTSPQDVYNKAKILLKEQKSYLVSVNEKEYDTLNLIKDISSKEDLVCPNCNNKKVLNLIRDLSKGRNYYKVSLICPNCL